MEITINKTRVDVSGNLDVKAFRTALEQMSNDDLIDTLKSLASAHQEINTMGRLTLQVQMERAALLAATDGQQH
jgi:hypothetical protein